MHPRMIPFIALCIGITLSLNGCRAPYEDGTGAEVRGTVSLDGKPVTVGMVLFLPYNGIDVSGNSTSANIKSDGTYEMTNVPTGTVKVVVKTSMFKGQAMAQGKSANAPVGKSGGAPTLSGEFRAVPPTYEDAAKTPLTTTVNKGQQSYDIQMTSPKS